MAKEYHNSRKYVHTPLKVAGYGNGHGQRPKRNNSQWLHVLDFPCLPESVHGCHAVDDYLFMVILVISGFLWLPEPSNTAASHDCLKNIILA